MIISAFERHALEVKEYPYDGYVLAINNEFARRYLARPYLNSALLTMQLMIQTQLPVGQTASDCGWTDANQFSRIFRQNEGCSLREYRLRRQEKV